MQGFSVVVLLLGIGAVIYGILQKLKAGRVVDAPLVPTGHAAGNARAVAGPKGQISAQGNVLCPEPVISPVTGTPCLFYQVTTTARWKENGNHRSKVMEVQKVAAKFSIDDGSGPVVIDAREGGDFSPSQKKTETQSAGLLGGIVGKDLMFGNHIVRTGMLSLGTKFTVEEEVLPIVPRVYACGRASEHGGAIAKPSWRKLILTDKSRNELLESATRGAKMFLLGGTTACVLGLGLGLTSRFVIDADAEPKAVASSEDPWKEAKASPLPVTAATLAPAATAAPPAPAPPAITVANAKGAPKHGQKPGAPKPKPAAKK